MIIIVKSFICYVQIDIAIISCVLFPIPVVVGVVCAAHEIMEKNVNTYGIVGPDFDSLLARAHQVGFVVLQALRWRVIRVGNQVCLQGDALAVVIRQLMSCEREASLNCKTQLR